MLDISALRAHMEQVIKHFDIPSASLTVYDNGTVFSVNVGYRDVEQKLPADEHTMYAIGSCTKSFVAAALCAQADEKRLNLDDTVKQYFPEFAMYDPYVTEHLTIRDILCHRCGLPRHELSWYSRQEEWSLEELLRRLRYLKPTAGLRYKMQYQNVMFALAGYLVEKISGQPWRDYVREKFLEPLGMEEVNFSVKDMARLDNRATAYSVDRPAGQRKAVPYCDIDMIGAAGCINATSASLIRWPAMFLNDGILDGKRVLPPELCKECYAPHSFCPEQSEGAFKGYKQMTSYGLGWFVEMYRGQQVVQHGGSIDGFIAHQGFLPGTGFGYSLLTNLGETTAIYAISYHLIDLFLGKEPADWISRMTDALGEADGKLAEAEAKLKEKRPTGSPCPVPLDAVCGKYEEPGYGDIIIVRQDDSLTARIGDISLAMEHYAGPFFLLREEMLFPGASVMASLDVDYDGTILGFAAQLEPTEKEKIYFRRQAAK